MDFRYHRDYHLEDNLDILSNISKLPQEFAFFVMLWVFNLFHYIGLPSITSVTSSPHVAVEDSSDVLYVDVENEAELESVDWYYNGKVIAIEDQHYSFPGKLCPSLYCCL